MGLTSNRAACAVVAVALAAAAGCGPQRAEVSGRVTYRGKTVEVGAVTLLGADGLPVIAAIDGGRYRGAVPIGPVRVGVSSYDPAVQLQAYRRDGTVPAEITAELTAQRARWFPVPNKFVDPRSSGLTLDVATSGESFDLDLQ